MKILMLHPHDIYSKLEPWTIRVTALATQLVARGHEVGDGRGVVEPTSGNTGISLAAMAKVRGYPMRAVVPNRVPMEKKVLLKLCGADLDVLSDELCPTPGAAEVLIRTKPHADGARDPVVFRARLRS